MICDQNDNLESRNFIDGVDFTRNDPCIFVVYPPGAAGDLLTSIIDKHYLRTGCEYYGISNTGKVELRTTDYDQIDAEIDATGSVLFDQQWFFNLASKLGERNLNYSLLDQVIFSGRMSSSEDIKRILDIFPKAKIINIYPIDKAGLNLITFLELYKNRNIVDLSLLTTDIVDDYRHNLVLHNRVLNIPFGALFNDSSYKKYYNTILDFLKLSGQLICFDYIKFYLSKQHPEIKNLLIEYSKSL